MGHATIRKGYLMMHGLSLSGCSTTLFLLALVLLGWGSSLEVHAETIYVDGQIAEASTAAYDPASRKAGSGSARAFKTLAGACSVAEAGATVLIRGGTYAEALAPKQSGAAGKPITFKAYEKEAAIISGESLAPAVELSGKAYITIEGLQVVKVRRWLHAVKSNHLILRDNLFRQALDAGGSAKTGLFFQEAHHNRIVGNTIDDTTQDNLALIKSNHNLVEGNIFLKAKHVLWTVKGGCYNVIRCNYLHNAIQKIGEVYDCQKVGFDHEFTELNCTKRNLIEYNVFAFTPSSGDHSPYAGIQYAGQDGIVRHNIFYDTIGPALDLTMYPDEARHNTGNRVAHNTFHKSRFAGLCLSGKRDDPKYVFENNAIKNNVFTENRFQRNDKRWAWYQELDGKPVQVFIGALGGFVFERNLVFGGAEDQTYLIVTGKRDGKNNPAPQALASWQANLPELFRENLEADPKLKAPAAHDYRPQPDSPCVDGGACLTAAKGAGEGTELSVADARWFSDGMGVEGLAGDTIQLAGEPATYRVTKVDIAKNVLTLEKPAKWKDGQGVSYAFAGKAPDLGAYESGLPEPPATPAAPAADR
ncbi:MAG: hypothetical protein AMXMBFR7_33430 [Planctomycetota bacterium]